jgi:hypothetical protein
VKPLDAEMASQFARLAQQNIAAEYPNKLDHLLEHGGEASTPRSLHPVFFGSYDWHSSVHMHWLLVRLISLYPEAAFVERVAYQLDTQFTAQKIAGECAYLRRHTSRTFERTYGWAWLLALHGELVKLAPTFSRAKLWAEQLAPLTTMFRQRLLNYLPLADFPIRCGTHQNSAFALLLARITALQTDDAALLESVDAKAHQWFGTTRSYPCWLEPQGSDFLSAGLMEAALMQTVLGDSFQAWWSTFTPNDDDLAVWLTPVSVSDRSDAQLSHLDGLNLSRAWCLKRLAMPESNLHRVQFLAAAEQHVAASLPYVQEGHYVGTHWLASFATLALCSPASDRL